MGSLQRRPEADPAGFSVGFVQFRSPLLLESQLISFPPANDMLKFTG